MFDVTKFSYTVKGVRKFEVVETPKPADYRAAMRRIIVIADVSSIHVADGQLIESTPSHATGVDYRAGQRDMSRTSHPTLLRV